MHGLLFEKDINYRQWNASHGGLYAPISESTLPNEYLEVPERDVVTTSGIALTLINPAYMTRQVHELASKKSGVLGHITSLNPIRPENAADAWEKAALESFELHQDEASGFSDINGETYFRYMAPLYVSEACTKCHEAQGYKVGDVRGGISISLPSEYINSSSIIQTISLFSGHFILWMIGLMGINYSSGQLLNSAKRQRGFGEELKKSNDQMESERNLARQYFNISGVLLIKLDDEGFILSINQKAGEVLGADPETAKGLNWFNEFIPENIREEAREAHYKLMKGELDDYEYYANQIQTRTGELREIAWRNSVIRDDQGEIVSTLSSGDDITDLNRSEIALQENERRLSTLMDNLTGMVYRCLNDSNWTMQFVSRGSEKLSGYTPDELIADPAFVYSNILYPDDRYRIWQQVQAAIQENMPFEVEFRIKHKNGDVRWVLARGLRVSSPEVSPEVLEGYIFDITERKQAEEMLESQLDEALRFQKVTVNRELRMKELQDEIKALKTGRITGVENEDN